MPAQIVADGDLLLAHKPSGVTTHRSESEEQGFSEWLSSQRQQSLWACHRLDQGTSGALVLATSSENAARVGELFAKRLIKKNYLLLSPHKSNWDEWTVSEEKKEDPECFQGPPQQEGGMQTHFLWKACQHGLNVYLASPLSGKTHQVRKHANRSGIPILGDDLYGGAPFPRLMLHSQSLSFLWKGQSLELEAELPWLFSDLSHCRDLQWASWLNAVERRFRLFPELCEDKKQSLRWIHRECGDLRGDKVGPVQVWGWWQDQPPSSEEIQKVKSLNEFLGYENWQLTWRPRKTKAKCQLQGLQENHLPESWEFQEGDCRYLGQAHQGHNFGLFLDQRERRAWVRKRAKNQRVLNLFSYTCGFSLAAALGGAKQVVSVDSMKKYLHWGEQNFKLNSLKPEDWDFICMDTEDYLAYAIKKQLQFDMIICDPPSFSRSQKKKKRTFRIERDGLELVKTCLSLLSPGGCLLFSNNYEKWDLLEWKKRLVAAQQTLGFSRLEWSFSQWDFECRERQANLKAFFIYKA